VLEHLALKDVAAPGELAMDLAPRMNVITGDNGLGKTLLLDAAWYVLTRTWPHSWPGKGVVPAGANAAIVWQQRRGSAAPECVTRFDFHKSHWATNYGADAKGWNSPHGLVIYGRVDGGFSISDPLRVGHDFRLPFGQQALGTSTTFQFSSVEVWEGLELVRNGTSVRLCEGLLRDWPRWALDPRDDSFARFEAIVRNLAPEPEMVPLREWKRVFIDDARDIPILRTAAGDIAVIHAPASVRRILALAYICVWAWREHRAAAELKRMPVTTSFTLLLDEIEGHLHPKWQRIIAPTVPGIAKALGDGVEMQTLFTTHSPLVMASLEPSFDSARDAWFDLDLEGENGDRHVVLRRRDFHRLGDASSWLTSEAFDLKEASSLPAERAIEAARAVLREPTAAREKVEQADAQLRATLSDVDPFFIRWGKFLEEQGIQR
jgi:hypothetical protein